MTALALGVSAGLLILIALLRAGGASLVRTPRADALRLAADGNHRAAVAASLLEDRPRLQPALGMSLTILTVAAVVPGVWALTRSLDGWGLLAGLVILSAVLVLAGDIVPRVLGRSRPGALAYALIHPVRLAVIVGSATADVISELDEDEDEPDDEPGADESERELISSVLDFSDAIVREVMTPRPDVVSVSAEATTDEALSLVLSAGRSRIPVTGDSADDVVGVLYARDLLQMMDEQSEHTTARSIMREPYFVPETKSVPELLREMQGSQIHLAIVVDEFGGTAGLVTIEDLLEEIVGEIADEYDDEEPLITETTEGEFLVDGRLGVDELGEIMGVDLPDGEWDTVGGLMLSLAGRVPKEGESFEYESHVFVADKIQGRRVARVRLRGS